MKKQVVFVIIEDNLLGQIIQPFSVKILANKQWSVDVKRIYSLQSKYLDFEISEIEKKLIELTTTLQLEYLYQKFELLREKKVQNNSTYFTDLTLKKYIHPFVSAQVASILQICKEHQIPVHVEDKNNVHSINEQPLIFSNDIFEPQFLFDFSHNGLQYSLFLRLQHKHIKVSDCRILSYNPCFILHNNVIYSAIENFDGLLLKPFEQKEKIVVAREKIGLYIKTFVSKIIREYTSEIKGLAISDVYITPKAILRVEQTRGKKFSIGLYFQYQSHIIPAHYTARSLLHIESNNSNYRFEKIHRDDAFEAAVRELLSKAGFINLQYHQFAPCDEQYAENLESFIRFLSEKHHLFYHNKLHIKCEIDNQSLSFIQPTIETRSIKQHPDWFDLYAVVHIDEYEIPFTKFIPNIISSNPVFTLPDGRKVLLPQAWLSKLMDVAYFSDYDLAKPSMKLKKTHFPLLQTLEMNGNNGNDCAQLEALMNKNVPILNEPMMLKTQLRTYQKIGMSWFLHLHQHQFGGCLADDMGLGKTIQVLAYFLKLLELYHEQQKQNIEEHAPNRKPFTHLIVCPLSLIHNWLNEIQRFAPSLQVLNYTGSERHYLFNYFQYVDVIITSYGVIRNDIDLFRHIEFHTIILDESQFIKNPESRSYEALLQLRSKQRLVLTGTPLENNLIDIWSQMNFVNPGILGSLKQFKETFVQPIEKYNDKDALQRIQKIIGPFILRRTKRQVADELPPLTEKIYYCSMTPEQAEYYEQKKSEIRNYILEQKVKHNIKYNRIIMLAGLTRLRLIANHPRLTDPDYKGQSGKHIEIFESLEKLLSENHKALVFSQFVKHLHLIEQYLQSKQIPYLLLTGRTTQHERAQIIRKFSSSNSYPFLLMTMKAGGVGLNLTAADYVLLIDPWWNPAAEMQAIHRTHRFGQTNNVFAYKFITEKTIEEKILLLQQKKSSLFQQVIEQNVFQMLNEQELLELLQ